MGRRLRKGDLVTIVSGDDRGKRGRILRVYPEEGRVVVENVNLVFKHLRRSQQNPQGGRIRREAPVHMSNVMPIDPETNKPTRVRMRTDGTHRIRVTAHSNAELDTIAKKAGKGSDDVAQSGES